MVVSDEYSNGICNLHQDCRSRPGALSTVSVPPIVSARSLNPISPKRLPPPSPRVESDAVILDHHHDSFVSMLDQHIDLGRMSMTKDIGHRLLDDPVECDLDVLLKPLAHEAAGLNRTTIPNSDSTDRACCRRAASSPRCSRLGGRRSAARR